jgi:hypothetical protein
MKNWFLLLVVVSLPLVSGCQSLQPVSAQAPPERGDLRREVQLLNLINGLELTPEQMRFILERAQQAQDKRDALRDQADVEEMDATLGEIRDTLMAGQTISPELTERFFAARADNERLLEAYRGEVTRLAGEVEDVLEEHQLYTLEHYVPCVIPPPGELRVGQAQGAGSGVVLERLRAMPGDRFERRKEGIARLVMKRLEARFHGRVLILDEAGELNRIVDLLERARSLSEVDFELQKEDLVEELLAPYQVTQPPVEPTAVIARHLLDPVIIPLLEEKLALAGESLCRCTMAREAARRKIWC